MQIICATREAASRVLLLLMTAGHRPIHVYGLPPEEPLSPPYTIILPQPLDAPVRTQIEQIRDTQMIVD